LHETLVVETQAAFTILGLLLVFLPMFLSVLTRGETSPAFTFRDSSPSRSPGRCRS
jgi:hypothetical protein